MPNLQTAGLMFFAAALIAQQTAGTLSGVLTDASGAVIPAATISLSGEGIRKTAVTQVNGSYSFSGSPPGQYTLRVEFPGFETFEKSLRIDTGGVQFPIQMTLSGGRQEVTVTEEQRQVLTTDPSHNASSLVISDQDLDALPDDPDDLTDMLTQLAGPSAGVGNGPTVLIDGFSGGQLPPKGAIKEIKINQNPFSAEYEDLGFGRIEIVTKPGAGNFHGGLGLTDSDAWFNSRNPYAANKADYLNRMVTANAGGPLSHRLSYTLNFQQSTINNTALIDAVTLDPDTLAAEPVRSSVVTPRSDVTGTARIDAQLTPANTFTARYQHLLSDRQNNGIGQYNLVSREYSNTNTRDDIQLTDTQVLSANAVGDFRFSYTRNETDQYGNNTIPSIVVTNSFGTGGAQVGRASNANQLFEGQANATVVHGTHTVRLGMKVRHSLLSDSSPTNFGGTFTFFGVTGAPVLDAGNQVELDGNGNPVTTHISSLEQYRRTLLFENLGYPAAQIRALGGGASQFSIAGGNPLTNVSQTDVGLFVLDDWRLKPNFTLSLGLRYEKQTNIQDSSDIGPRIAVAWSPRVKAGSTPKTVIRAGTGMFYNRVGSNITLQQLRYNGVTQQQYVVSNPDFYPSIPQTGSLVANLSSLTTYHKDPRLHPLSLMVAGVTVEQQLPFKTTLSGNYIYARVTHLISPVNINTPLPGTEVRPYGNAAGNLFQYESDFYIIENIAWMTLNTKLNQKVSFNVNYQYLSANGDGDGGMPSNPYNFRQDYSRSTFVRPHNFNVVGNFIAPGKIQFSPLFIASSGNPYNLTVGTDLNGDTIANDRPAFATDLSRPSVVVTRFGAFDTNPIPGQTLVPRNYLTGAPMWNLNMRVGRTFGFGKLKTAAQAPANGTPPGGERRFSLNFNVDINNVFNHLNPGGYVGNLSSPLFGQSTAIFLFRDTSNNRRVQFGTQFNF